MDVEAIKASAIYLYTTIYIYIILHYYIYFYTQHKSVLYPSAVGDELNIGRMCKHHTPSWAKIPLMCAQKTDNSPNARQP